MKSAKAFDIVDFDNIDDWAPKLARELSPYVPNSVEHKILAAAPKYIEEARNLLFDLTDRKTIIDATLSWIRSTNIAGYHGTRMTDAEASSVRATGLILLKAESRRPRIIRALSSHPKWNSVAGQLDAVIQAHGQGESEGRRENQVHLTLSRTGLVSSFNHYLTHGAEFDQRVAHALLGPEGKELLAFDGEPTMIRVAVPGDLAVNAAHPIFSVNDTLARGDVPNIASEFLKAWSYRLSQPGYQCRTLLFDCGMIFFSTVPADWIINVDTFVD